MHCDPIANSENTREKTHTGKYYKTMLVPGNLVHPELDCPFIIPMDKSFQNIFLLFIIIGLGTKYFRGFNEIFKLSTIEIIYFTFLGNKVH